MVLKGVVEKVFVALRVAARTSWIRVLVHVALLSFLVELLMIYPALVMDWLDHLLPFLASVLPVRVSGLCVLVRRGG